MPKKLDTEAIIDEIRDNSRMGYPKEFSIVDTLLEAHWCQEQDLALAYGILESSELAIAMACFQLPFVVRLPEKWIKLKSQYGFPYIHFRTTGTRVNTIDSSRKFDILSRKKYGDTERFINATLPNDVYGLLTQTQVLISFQLWGKKLTMYDQYSEYQALLQDPKLFENKKIYPPKGTRSSSNPLTPQTFEIEVAKRLYKQTEVILKEFIPTYAVSCADPFAHMPKELTNYFVMTKPGRVVVRGLSSSAIAQQAQPYQASNYSQNLTALKQRMESERPPSIYEQYLLEAARQADMGACNLAVVQTFMVLDLFANEIINDRIIRQVRNSLMHVPEIATLTIERMWEKDERIWPSTMEKYKRFFPIADVKLPANLLNDLNKIRILRNRIVHRRQATPIESDVANKVVNTGFAIIRYCMGSLLEKNKARAATNT